MMVACFFYRSAGSLFLHIERRCLVRPSLTSAVQRDWNPAHRQTEASDNRFFFLSCNRREHESVTTYIAIEKCEFGECQWVGGLH